MLRCRTLVAVVLMSSVISAQAKKPDFSGTWVLDLSKITNLLTGKPIEVPAGKVQGGAAVATPGDTVVTQTPEAMTIVSKGRGTVTHVFKQDGSENVNRNGAETHTSRARWEKGRFIVEGTSYSVTSAGESTRDIKEVIYLNPEGALVIEVTSSVDGKPTFSSRRVYMKK